MENLKRNEKCIPCQVCDKRKWDVQKIKIPETIMACPECREELKNTTICLKVTCDWMMKKFETHQRTCKPFVLKPYITDSYINKATGTPKSRNSFNTIELQKVPTPHPYPTQGSCPVNVDSPTVNMENTKMLKMEVVR